MKKMEKKSQKIIQEERTRKCGGSALKDMNGRRQFVIEPKEQVVNIVLDGKQSKEVQI